MGSRVLNGEGVLRLVAMVLATATALIVGLDAQTKNVFFVERTATVKDLQALWVLTIMASVAAGYQLIQFCRCLAMNLLQKDLSGCGKMFLWACLFLDQGTTYLMFAMTMAATQASIVGLVGVKAFQWSKVCNIYSRFCNQVGGGLFCGLAASLAMAVVSSISAHRLFRLYPQKIQQQSSPESHR